MTLLRRAGYIFHTTSEFEIVKKIKEKYCYVAPTTTTNDEFSKINDERTQTNYILPDGTTMKISSEKFKAPEILFSPDKIGLEYPGVHEMVVNAIKQCDIDLRKTLYNNIIAAGGSTLTIGFSDRLHKSISKLVSKDMKVTLIAPNNRLHSCWIGGATVSSLKAFSRMWVSKKDYEEEGARILLRQSI
jgi:centractin